MLLPLRLWIMGWILAPADLIKTKLKKGSNGFSSSLTTIYDKDETHSYILSHNHFTHKVQKRNFPTISGFKVIYVHVDGEKSVEIKQRGMFLDLCV